MIIRRPPKLFLELGVNQIQFLIAIIFLFTNRLILFYFYLWSFHFELIFEVSFADFEELTDFILL